MHAHRYHYNAIMKFDNSGTFLGFSYKMAAAGFEWCVQTAEEIAASGQSETEEKYACTLSITFHSLPPY